MIVAVALFATLLMAGSVVGQQTTAPPTTMCDFSAAEGRYCANWVVDTAANAITFTVQAQTLGWVGLAVSMNPSGHQDTDSIVGWVDGDGVRVFDGISNAQGRPLLDEDSNVVLVSGNEENGMTTLQYRRSLVSTDVEGDTDIWNTPMTLAWAIGDLDGSVNDDGSPVYAQHSMFGRDSINLLANTNVISGSFSANNGAYVANWISDQPADVLIMRISADTQGWIGLGISGDSSGHSNTDSAVGWVDADGIGVIFDGFSNRRSRPVLDGTNSLTLLQSSEIDGTTSLVYSRPIMAMDQDDTVINPEPMTLAWAYGTADGSIDNNSPVYAQHSSRGRDDNVNFLQASDAADALPNSPRSVAALMTATAMLALLL